MPGVFDKLAEPLLYHRVNQASVRLVGIPIVFGAVMVQLWVVASSFHFMVVRENGLIKTRKILGCLADVCVAVSLDCLRVGLG